MKRRVIEKSFLDVLEFLCVLLRLGFDGLLGIRLERG